VKHPLARSPVVFLLCCLAFAAAYLSVNHAFGQGEPAEPAPTPDASVTLAPDLTLTPTLDGVTPDEAPSLTPTETPAPSATAPTQTPTPDGSWSSSGELGERAPAGSVFDKYGVRLRIPEGFGDFWVLYPVIVNWGTASDADHPDVIMTVYNAQTRSAIFLRFEDNAKGPRAVEVDRRVEQPEIGAALDSLMSTAEVVR